MTIKLLVFFIFLCVLFGAFQYWRWWKKCRPVTLRIALDQDDWDAFDSVNLELAMYDSEILSTRFAKGENGVVMMYVNVKKRSSEILTKHLSSCKNVEVI